MINRASCGAKPAPLCQGVLQLTQWVAQQLAAMCPQSVTSQKPIFSLLCVAVRSVKNKPAFFADKLYKSMKVQMGSPGAELWEGAMWSRHPSGLPDLTPWQ